MATRARIWISDKGEWMYEKEEGRPVPVIFMYAVFLYLDYRAFSHHVFYVIKNPGRNIAGRIPAASGTMAVLQLYRGHAVLRLGAVFLELFLNHVFGCGDKPCDQFPGRLCICQNGI